MYGAVCLICNAVTPGMRRSATELAPNTPGVTAEYLTSTVIRDVQNQLVSPLKKVMPDRRRIY